MQPKRVLVALAGTSADPDIVRLVASIAKPAKAEVVGVHVVEVRWNLPLDAVLEPELDRGEELLASAKKIAEQAGLALETELLQARDAAAAIVDTAVERKCDLIALAMPFRKRLGRTYVGRTVQNVYVNAPCAVLAYRQEETKCTASSSAVAVRVDSWGVRRAPGGVASAPRTLRVRIPGPPCRPCARICPQP